MYKNKIKMKFNGYWYIKLSWYVYDIYICNYKVIWVFKYKYYFVDNVFEYIKTNRIVVINIDLW